MRLSNSIVLLIAASTLSLAACTTQQLATSQPTSIHKVDQQCLALEQDFIGMNSEDMRRLFGTAQERYQGAMPCVGAAAALRNRAATSPCELPHDPYVLQRVQGDGPAYFAGLRDGDVIDSVNGRPIRFPMDFDVTVLSASPGSFIALRIKRADQTFIGQVRVGAQLPGDGATCTPTPIR